jgi:hypothetical protein
MSQDLSSGIHLKALNSQIQANTDAYSSDYQRVIYQNIETTKVVQSIFYFFWAFYFSVLILCYFLYKEPTMSITTKIVVLLHFVLYPLFIYICEQQIYAVYSYFYSILTGTPYVTVYVSGLASWPNYGNQSNMINNVKINSLPPPPSVTDKSFASL